MKIVEKFEKNPKIQKQSQNPKIKKLVTWAAVSDLDRNMFHESTELDQWKEDGVLYVLNRRTKQKMPHFIQFYFDYKKNKKRLCVENAVKKMMSHD